MGRFFANLKIFLVISGWYLLVVEVWSPLKDFSASRDIKLQTHYTLHIVDVSETPILLIYANDFIYIYSILLQAVRSLLMSIYLKQQLSFIFIHFKT